MCAVWVCIVSISIWSVFIYFGSFYSSSANSNFYSIAKWWVHLTETYKSIYIYTFDVRALSGGALQHLCKMCNVHRLPERAIVWPRRHSPYSSETVNAKAIESRVRWWGEKPEELTYFTWETVLNFNYSIFYNRYYTFMRSAMHIFYRFSHFTVSIHAPHHLIHSTLTMHCVHAAHI